MPPPSPTVVVVQQSGCTGQTLFVYFLRFLKIFAILALLADIVAYCLAMKGAILSENLKDYSKGFFVLSSVGFCLVALMQIVGEFEPRWFIFRIRVMKYWIARGFLLSWQGIQTINSGEVIGEFVTDMRKEDFKLASDIVGWSLIGIGGLYVLMSTLCLKKMCGLKRPDEIQIRIVSDERMDRFGTTIGAGSDYEAYSGSSSGKKGSSALTPEARTVISNMAIALDITSSRAWDMFNGPAGAEEARRICQERRMLKDAAMSSSSGGGGNNKKPRFDDDEDAASYQPPTQPNRNATPAAVNVGGDHDSGYSPTYTNDADDDDPRARRMLQRDEELEAQYYASSVN